MAYGIALLTRSDRNRHRGFESLTLRQVPRVPLDGRQTVLKTVDTRCTRVWGSNPLPSAKI